MFLNADAPGAEADSLSYQEGVFAEETESLQKFLSRVLQLYTIDLTTLTITVPAPLPVLTDYLNTASVKRKWINYHLLKADIVLDIQVLSNAFAYGQIIIAVNYSDWIAEYGSTAYNALGRYVQASKEHVILDVGMSNTATLRIPWNQPLPMWDLQLLPSTQCYPVIEISKMGNLYRADDGGVAVGTLIVNAHLENVHIAVPTPAVNVSARLKRRDTPAPPGGLASESKEATNRGFVSGPLSAISDATRMLKNTPFFGKTSEAISEASGGLAKAASIFGWSRPRDLSPGTTIGFTDETNCAALDQFKSLTLDPNAAVQPALENQDNLSFQNTVGRKGISSAFNYALGDAPGKILASIPVHPGLTWRSGAESLFALTPLAYYSHPYRMWRGTIDVRLDFIASRYHRGRVRVIYSPYKLDTATVPADVSLTSYNFVVDISCSTTVEFSVPWMSADPYLPAGLVFLDTDPVNTNSNGFISIQVVNQLQAPSATGADVMVLAWYKAGKDFELAEHEGLLNVTPFSPTMTLTEISNSVDWLPIYENPQDPSRAPLPGSVLKKAYRGYTNQSQVAANDAAVTAGVLATLGREVDSSRAAVTYVGERFNSFRPLAKRFSTAMIIPCQSNDNHTTVFALPRMPPSAGVYQGQLLADTKFVGPFIECNLAYLCAPFRGTRGSTRVNINPTPTANPGRSVTYVSFPVNAPIMSRQTIDHTDDPVANLYAREELSDLATGGKATAAFSAAYQEISFSIPYQQNGLYEIPNYWLGANRDNPTLYPSAVVVMPWRSVDSAVRVKYAAGEDFNPEVWVGIPPTFVATLPPKLLPNP